MAWNFISARHQLLALAWCCVLSAAWQWGDYSRDVDLPLESQGSYEIRVLSSEESPVAWGAVDGSQTSSMIDAAGKEYLCFLPPHEVALGIGSVAASRAQRVAALLHEVRRSSLVKRFGFWSYELDFGKSIRQFESSVAPEAVRRENLLGEYVPDQDTVYTSPLGSVLYTQLYHGGSDGRKAAVVYHCDHPELSPSLSTDIISVREGPPLQYEVVVGTREPSICQLLPSPGRLIAAVNGTCARHVEGWWTFEICLGRHIRQFHDHNGKVEQENVLGLYDWRYGETLDVASVGNAPAIVQQYTHGSACDLLNGEPRRATVRFECIPSAGMGEGQSLVTLNAIQEPSTCVYKFMVGTSVACEHPDVSPTKGSVVQLQTVGIPCLATPPRS